MPEKPHPERSNIPQKPSAELCPDCGLPATVIGRHEIEGHISVTTYECPNCHHFSKIIDLK
ncbi:MAG: hypothetical protein JSU01_16950 [Bacteroidetes bacterium]|nr:hypothetical protein [Bacteroidota bacterium]